MVRFTDIIKKRDKTKTDLGDKLTWKEGDEEKLWLSSSQVMKAAERGHTSEKRSSADDRDKITIYYKRFLESAANIRDRVKSDLDISPSPILADIHGIINEGLIEGLYEYTMSLPDMSEGMLVHTIDVTFASLIIGKGLDYDIKRLLKLGLAAFLENVGMYKIPDFILNKKGKLEKSEIMQIKKHPEISYEIIARMGKRYHPLAEVALQTHERSDGSGYPNGLKRKEISELASIIGLIDLYIAMIKNRPYRDKFIRTDAVKFIIKDAKGLFPSRILKTFLNQISLFPVNTYVRLNNKSIGRVLTTDKNQPLRPTIQLIYDISGNKIERREIIRLADDPLLYITESINEEELT